MISDEVSLEVRIWLFGVTLQRNVEKKKLNFREVKKVEWENVDNIRANDWSY